MARSKARPGGANPRRSDGERGARSAASDRAELEIPPPRPSPPWYPLTELADPAMPEIGRRLVAAAENREPTERASALARLLEGLTDRATIVLATWCTGWIRGLVVPPSRSDSESAEMLAWAIQVAETAIQIGFEVSRHGRDAPAGTFREASSLFREINERAGRAGEVLDNVGVNVAATAKDLVLSVSNYSQSARDLRDQVGGLIADAFDGAGAHSPEATKRFLKRLSECLSDPEFVDLPEEGEMGIRALTKILNGRTVPLMGPTPKKEAEQGADVPELDTTFRPEGALDPAQIEQHVLANVESFLRAHPERAKEFGEAVAGLVEQYRPPSTERTLNLRQAADRIGISHPAVFELLDKGRLGERDDRGKPRFSEYECDQYRMQREARG